MILSISPGFLLFLKRSLSQAQDMTAASVWLERAQDAGAKLGKATFTALIEAMAKKAWARLMR